MIPGSTPNPYDREESYFSVITESGAKHKRNTRDEADELADQLTRYGWVEIVAHWSEDDEPRWEVVAELPVA